MTQATITEIRPDGRPPYQSPHGALYGFVVSFDSNIQILANSKSETPPYRSGDVVYYEITGQAGKMSKGKITKNPPPQFTPKPQVQPPYQPPAIPPPVAGRPLGASEVEAINPVFGAMVGMAMNNALELLTKGLEHDEVIERIITPEFWKSVWEVSSDQIRVARELEKGRLALSPKDRTKSILEAKRATSAGPATQTQDDETLDPPF